MTIKLLTEGFQSPMCQDPISIGTLAASAAGGLGVGGTLGTALTIGGGILSAVGKLQEASAAKSAAKFNARQSERDAEIAKQQTVAETNKQKRLFRLQEGSNIAKAGGMGRGLGAFEELFGDTAAEQELNLLTIKNQGQLRQDEYLADAALSRASGANAMKAGYIGAGTSILNAGSKAIYDRKMLA